MENKETKDRRGGYRPEAGRKPKASDGNRVNLTVMVSPLTRQRVTALRAKGVLLGEAVDGLVDTLAKQYGID